MHKLFYYHIDQKEAGKYRRVPIIISGTDYVPPSPKKIPGLMKIFLKNLPEKRKKMHPVEFSAHLHLELVNIHPFVDGNGRTARLLMNLSLFQSGYVITIIPPILRHDYISLLKKAQTGSKNPREFYHFISEMVWESSRDYLRLLKSIQD